MSQSNAVNATFINTTIDEEARMMRELPEKVRNWLFYDAPANYDITEVHKMCKLGIDENTVLNALKSIGRRLTMKTYGGQHPSLAYAGQASKKAA